MSKSFDEGLVTVLSGLSPSIQAYSLVPEQPSFPVVAYGRIYINRTHTISGGVVGVTEVGLQIDILGRTKTSVEDLADQIRTALDGYSGSWGALICRYVKCESEADFVDADGDRRIFRVSQRYVVWTNMV